MESGRRGIPRPTAPPIEGCRCHAASSRTEFDEAGFGGNGSVSRRAEAQRHPSRRRHPEADEPVPAAGKREGVPRCEVPVLTTMRPPVGVVEHDGRSVVPPTGPIEGFEDVLGGGPEIGAREEEGDRLAESITHLAPAWGSLEAPGAVGPKIPSGWPGERGGRISFRSESTSSRIGSGGPHGHGRRSPPNVGPAQGDPGVREARSASSGERRPKS